MTERKSTAACLLCFFKERTKNASIPWSFMLYVSITALFRQ